jgi:CRP/FNR family transcriptional regulator, cyclic AMP receptor protein
VTTISVLKADPDLGAGIDERRREIAQRACLAKTLEIPRAAWDADAATSAGERSGFGLLVVSGVLSRRVVQNECHGAELIGPGDLLRPWDPLGDWPSIPTESSWLAIERSRIAILDAEFARRTTPFPEISLALIRRGLLRSRYLATLIAIISQRRIETRLRMLFWHLADRFGQMRGEWVSVPVPLTHSLLSELVAARRPSVTTALSRLQERGELRREGRGWLLRGPAPTGVGAPPAGDRNGVLPAE